MLDLIARIGGEFGISIVVSSHLLGEVERICDHLVALESGALLRADTLTSFTQVSHVLAIEVDDGMPELAGDELRVFAGGEHQGRVGVAQLVGLARRDAETLE